MLNDPDGGGAPYGVCLQDLGKDIKNPDVCKNLLPDKRILYEICVSTIAIKVKDPTMCNLIQAGTNTYDDCMKGSGRPG